MDLLKVSVNSFVSRVTGNVGRKSAHIPCSAAFLR